MEKFIKFLEENNAWEGFEKAFKERGVDPKYYAENRKRDNFKAALKGAFTWAETREGHYYWEKLNDKWMEEIGTLKDKLIKEYNKL